MTGIIQKTNRALWALLLLALPLSSAPLVAKIFKASSVAPLSLLPLFILVFTFLLPKLWKQKALPKSAVPLLLFTLLAVLSIAASGFNAFPSHRDANQFRNALKDLLTLGIGICFYLTAIFWNENSKSLKFSLHWINIGGVLLMVYSAFQFIIWRIYHSYPLLLIQFQCLLSTSLKLYDGRVTGFALEPSWLAHQLNMLYLPIWLAFTLNKTSIYQLRLKKKFTVENILLTGGLLTLIATLSRVGWLSMGALILFVLIRWINQRVTKLLNRRLLNSKKSKKIIFQIFFWSGITLLGVILGALGLKVLSALDPKRMTDVFNFSDLQRQGLLGWANRLEMAERLLYWMSAFQTFLEFPILGVGLGNAGFFFTRNLAAFGYNSPEIVRQILFENTLVNAKNLWARILAESGVLGFAAFAAWVYNQLLLSIELETRGNNAVFRSLGLAGIMLTICLLIEAFSIDSFGLPYYWISFGITMASSRLNADSETIALEDH